MQTMTAMGSIGALAHVLNERRPFVVAAGADVVILPTASAFSGAEAAAIQLASLFEALGAKVEALMNTSRDSSDEPYFAQRLRNADFVVISDGSALHATSVWRATPVGEAIRDSRSVIAVGAVASVFGDVMVDPRGGAPTNGLGYVQGLVIGVGGSDEQLVRTRSLLGDALFAVLGQEGVVHFDGTTWRAITDDVVTSRGTEFVAL
jgi:cyanophycinase-like exopeptidase